MSAHSFEEHPGEVQIRLDGDRLDEVFSEAAVALAELMGTPTEDPPGPWQHVTVDANGHDKLLVVWLNELIARTTVDRLLYEVAIEEIAMNQLHARIRGVPIDQPRSAVKVATVHGLALGEGTEHVSATVVIST